MSRETVLPAFPTADGRLLIVGSRGGARTDPHRAHDLRANPEVSIRHERKDDVVRERINAQITSHSHYFPVRWN
jgi:hypothetical protein